MLLFHQTGLLQYGYNKRFTLLTEVKNQQISDVGKPLISATAVLHIFNTVNDSNLEEQLRKQKSMSSQVLNFLTRDE